MSIEKPMDLKPCPYCGRPGSLIDGLAECTDPDCENTIMMSPEGWNRRPVESVPAPVGLDGMELERIRSGVKEALKEDPRIQVFRDMATLLAEVDRLRAALSPRPATGARECCTWTKPENGPWEPGCQPEPSVWEGDDPSYCGAKFCMYCGKPLVEAPATGADQGGAT